VAPPTSSTMNASFSDVYPPDTLGMLCARRRELRLTAHESATTASRPKEAADTGEKSADLVRHLDRDGARFRRHRRAAHAQRQHVHPPMRPPHHDGRRWIGAPSDECAPPPRVQAP